MYLRIRSVMGRLGVALVATDCADKCAPGAFAYAWPVEFQVSGGCH